ncbi:hypothetical protein ABBQ32_003564 [Trebouxia sp. C0010 RCD-2024]
MQWLNTGCCSWCLHQGWQQLGTSTPSSWASLTRTMTKAQCSNAVHLKAEADQEQCELHDKLASLGRRKGSVVWFCEGKEPGCILNALRSGTQDKSGDVSTCMATCQKIMHLVVQAGDLSTHDFKS